MLFLACMEFLKKAWHVRRNTLLWGAACTPGIDQLITLTSKATSNFTPVPENSISFGRASSCSLHSLTQNLLSLLSVFLSESSLFSHPSALSLPTSRSQIFFVLTFSFFFYFVKNKSFCEYVHWGLLVLGPLALLLSRPYQSSLYIGTTLFRYTFLRVMLTAKCTNTAQYLRRPKFLTTGI